MFSHVLLEGHLEIKVNYPTSLLIREVKPMITIEVANILGFGMFALTLVMVVIMIVRIKK